MTEAEKSQKKMKNESILSNLYEINHRRLNSFKRSQNNSGSATTNVSPTANRNKPKGGDNREDSNKENCKSQIRNSRSFSSRRKDILGKPKRMKTEENINDTDEENRGDYKPLLCKEDQLFIQKTFEKNYDSSKFQKQTRKKSIGSFESSNYNSTLSAYNEKENTSENVKKYSSNCQKNEEKFTRPTYTTCMKTRLQKLVKAKDKDGSSLEINISKRMDYIEKSSKKKILRKKSKNPKSKSRSRNKSANLSEISEQLQKSKQPYHLLESRTSRVKASILQQTPENQIKDLLSEIQENLNDDDNDTDNNSAAIKSVATLVDRICFERDQAKKELDQGNKAMKKILKMFSDLKVKTATMCQRPATLCHEASLILKSLEEKNKNLSNISIIQKSKILELEEFNKDLLNRPDYNRQMYELEEKLRLVQGVLDAERADYGEACNMMLIELDKSRAEATSLKENNFILKETSQHLIDALEEKPKTENILQILGIFKNLQKVKIPIF